MTRPKGEKRLTIGRKAVAVSIVAELLKLTQPGEFDMADSELTAWARRVVDEAYDSEYKMRSDQLVLTLDASMEAPDRADAMRSTPEDQPPEAPSLA